VSDDVLRPVHCSVEGRLRLIPEHCRQSLHVDSVTSKRKNIEILLNSLSDAFAVKIRKTAVIISFLPVRLTRELLECFTKSVETSRFW
jgi:hypothetical protein